MMKRTKAEVSPASPAPVRRTRSASATHSRKAKPAAAADVDTPVPAVSTPAAEPKAAKSRKKTAPAVEPAPIVESMPIATGLTPFVAPQVHVDPEAIAQLAYSYWEARGRQGGSQEEDWFRAEQELRSRLG